MQPFPIVSAFTLFFRWWNYVQSDLNLEIDLGNLRLSISLPLYSKLFDWTGRVFWIIVLMQNEAFPNESGGMFLNICRQYGFVLFQIHSATVIIREVISKVERVCSRDRCSCSCHDTASTMLYTWGCMFGIICSFPFSPHFCFPVT